MLARGWASLFLALVLSQSASAWAQESPTEPIDLDWEKGAITGELAPEATGGPDESTEAAGKVVQEPSKFQWKGRVFAQSSMTRIDFVGDKIWQSEMRLRSARLGLRYTHNEMLATTFKIEAAGGKAEIKDAYVRLSPDAFRIQAGRFKSPMSGISLASRWDLPMIERGLLDDVRVEGQKIPYTSGRREGVMVRYTAPVLGKLRLTAAAFQNDVGTGLVGFDASKDIGQDLYLRVQVEPTKELSFASTVAFFGYLGEALNADSYEHAPVVSVEAVHDGRLLRLWAELFAGRNMLAQADGTTEGSFVAGRAVVSTRLKTGEPRRTEPFVGVSYLDPKLGAGDDQDSNTEFLLGVNLAFSKRWRLQTELAHRLAQGALAPATEATAIRLQLGALFGS